MQPFKFNWKNFNVLAGLKYVFGILIIYLVSKWIEFPMLLVGLSALLAWLVVLLGKSHQQVRMVGLYLIIGLLLIWINNSLSSTYWPWLAFFMVVTFTGTLPLRYGGAWFMLGWSLIYLILLIPSFEGTFKPGDLIFGHLAGSGSVLLLVLVEQIWRNRKGKFISSKNDKSEILTWGRVIPYAAIVAIAIVFAMIIGHKWLHSDPTMVANSTFMIIGFSTLNTWKAGIERMLAALLGVLLGFSLGLLLQSQAFGIVIYLLASFLVLAMIEVNNGAVVFFFLIGTAYGWGLLEYEIGNEKANERLFAEFVGIALAGIVITLLDWLGKIKFRAINSKSGH